MTRANLRVPGAFHRSREGRVRSIQTVAYLALTLAKGRPVCSTHVWKLETATQVTAEVSAPVTAFIQGWGDEWITESLGNAGSSVAKQRSPPPPILAHAQLAVSLTMIVALEIETVIYWKSDTTYTIVFAAAFSDVGTPVLVVGGGGDCGGGGGGGGGGGAVEAVGAPCVGVTIGPREVFSKLPRQMSRLRPPYAAPSRIPTRRARRVHGGAGRGAQRGCCRGRLARGRDASSRGDVGVRREAEPGNQRGGRAGIPSARRQ